MDDNSFLNVEESDNSDVVRKHRRKIINDSGESTYMGKRTLESPPLEGRSRRFNQAEPPKNEQDPRTENNRNNRQATRTSAKKGATRTINKSFLDEEDDKEFKRMRRKKRIIKTVILTPIVLILLAIVVFGIKFWGPYNQIKSDADKISQGMSIDDFKLASNSHIYDKDGKELFTVTQDRNIEYLTYDEIPKDVFNCFISVEDIRFFEHNGVDLKSIARAGVQMVKNHGKASQGGSTLTQQLVKLTYLTTEKSYERKLKEVFIAMDVEKKFSKEQILEFYVNNVYFGNNAYGINSAALEYFNKPVKDLDISQIAFLCAIPNSPTYYDPYKQDDTGVNSHTIERRDLFLSKLLEYKYITQDQYDKAKAEQIKLERGDSNSKSFDTRKGFVEKEVVELLMEQNGFKFIYKFKTNEERQNYITSYNENYKAWRDKFYRKGYKVYTSFDSALQAKAQQVVDTDLKGQTEETAEGIYTRQAASITVDNGTGQILSMVGGRTSPKTDYLNRAYNTQRQNGSTMKPIAVYGPAFDLLGYTPATTEVDEEIKNGPKNSEEQFFGTVTMREALRISLNTVAWKTYQKVTPEKGLGYLQEMHFEYLTPDDNTLASGLGGLSIGTTPRELAGAYSTLANGGKYNKPSCVLKITDSGDTVLYQAKATNTQIYKPATAAMVTDMMRTVATSGTGANSQFNSAIQIAGKTGTTDSNKDLWFAGYSPKYTTVVWTGYDKPKEFRVAGNDSPVVIWRDIMKTLHSDGAKCEFNYGNSVKWVNVNKEGKEVPVGSPDSRNEIFPFDMTIEKGIIAHDEAVKGFKATLDNILDGANKSNGDALSLTIQISNAKTVIAQIAKAELNDDERNTLNNYANTIIKQMQSLQKPSGPTPSNPTGGTNPIGGTGQNGTGTSDPTNPNGITATGNVIAH